MCLPHKPKNVTFLDSSWANFRDWLEKFSTSLCATADRGYNTSPVVGLLLYLSEGKEV